MTPSEKNYIEITHCRSCKSESIYKVIDLGKQPLANEFVKHFGAHQEEYPLAVVFCNSCSLLQLSASVKKELMFSDYVYVSSTASSFVNHFKQLAKHLYSRYQPASMIDIGSNDGILLKPFMDLGVKAIGIEPAEKIAQEARNNGILTYSGWVDDDKQMEGLLKEIGQVDLVTACNVFAHVDNIHSFMANVIKFLKPEGTFVVEVAHLLKFVENNYFDTIYHEHFFYWSVCAMRRFVQQFDMDIVDVEEVPTHGGSIRVYIRKRGLEEPSPAVRVIIARELGMGLGESVTFKGINTHMLKIKERLTKFLDAAKHEGKRIVGYGAPAKGNTLLNYIKPEPHFISFLVDDSEHKQNLYTPGIQLAVLSPKILSENEPDFILIFAWNFANEIIKSLRDKGYSGSFIIPLPDFKII